MTDAETKVVISVIELTEQSDGCVGIAVCREVLIVRGTESPRDVIKAIEIVEVASKPEEGDDR